MLNKKQKQAVEHYGSPLLIAAGPGSGKTRVLTERVKWLTEEFGIPEHKILAITFTNKAAEEMKKRANKENSFISTFHKLCLHIISSAPHVVGLENNFSIYAQNESQKAMKDVMLELDMEVDNKQHIAMCNHISSLKNAEMDPETKEIQKVMEAYQKHLLDMNVLDFDDMLVFCLQILKTEHGSEWRERFAHVLVDEYQDTNRIQNSIVLELTKEHRQVTVVYDSDQSIYAFRGANYSNITDFKAFWEEYTLIMLEENYRSTSEIVKIANSIIQHNVNREPLTLKTNNKQGKKVDVKCFDSDKEEAEFIAQNISELQCYAETAVFCRTNVMTRLLEQSFANYEIPYIISGGLRFYERKEIADILAWLKFVYNPKDIQAFKRLIKSPTRGIGEKTMQKILGFQGETIIDKIHAFLEKNGEKPKIREILVIADKCLTQKTVPDMIMTVLNDSGYINKLEEQDTEDSLNRISNLYEFVRSADQNVSLPDFLESIQLVSDKPESSSEHVTISTIHAAKGLEFDNVYVIGLEEGVLPHARSKTLNEIEEERRLFYVAVTRAKKCLTITHCSFPRVFSNIFLGSSRFLNEVSLLADNQNVGKRVAHILQGEGTISRYSDKEVEILMDSGGIITIAKSFEAKVLKYL